MIVSFQTADNTASKELADIILDTAAGRCDFEQLLDWIIKHEA